MNYFARLAQRSGIATPRGPAPVVTAPAVPKATSVADVATIEQVVEIVMPAPAAQLNAPSLSNVAPGNSATPPVMVAAPATMAQPNAIELIPPAAIPTASAPATDADIALREEERIVVASTPAPTRSLETGTAVAPQSAEAPSSPSIASSPPHPTGRQPQNPSATSAAAADAAPFEVEAVVPAQAAAAPPSAVTRQAIAAPVPSIDENLESAVASVVPIAGRARGVPDTRTRWLERAATNERRARAEEKPRSGPVEVRIGTVTLQVQAAAPPAAAPARNGFAPHRHYLRLW